MGSFLILLALLFLSSNLRQLFIIEGPRAGPWFSSAKSWTRIVSGPRIGLILDGLAPLQLFAAKDLRMKPWLPSIEISLRTRLELLEGSTLMRGPCPQRRPYHYKGPAPRSCRARIRVRLTGAR